VSEAQDAERLATWRSWVHPSAKPEGWDRNLWDEFYGLQQRRHRWNGYRAVLETSPEDAQKPAAYLTQWVLRNHIETQAIAIRRIADRSTRSDTIALGRLLDEIAGAPQVLGVQGTDATADADLLEETAANVTTFANKVVAHLDADHAAASRSVNIGDLDGAVDVTLPIWQRWFQAITGEGVGAELPDDIGWWNVLRLHRRDIGIENPGFIGAKVLHMLGEGAARELLDVLKRSPEDRASLIGRLYGRSDGRWLAEALMDIEEDRDDLVRLRLITELELMFPDRQGDA
jgi:AbiU2